MADRIGCQRVSGDQKGLAATSSIVNITAVATTTRFRHPVVSTESSEGCGIPGLPYRVLAGIGKNHVGNTPRGLAGQNGAVWVDGQIDAAPSAHAGFRNVLVVIGQDMQELDLGRQSGAGRRDCGFGLPQLGQAREQSLIIEVCPANILAARRTESEIGLVR